ncbi:MAG: single-stranded DNA-binding protein [Candidatus Saelkia tenebricola]|nr:single-stranded DNA-binding protein [Candidatus Saelkia tenebricola]
MPSLNRVFLIGNLTRDPELRYTPAGVAVVSFGIAVNRVFKTQTGDKKEETCFVRIVTFGKQAESCNQFLAKGRLVFIEGRLQYRTWEYEGKKYSAMDVIADRVQFLTRGKEDASVVAEPDIEEEMLPGQNIKEVGLDSEGEGNEVPF